MAKVIQSLVLLLLRVYRALISPALAALFGPAGLGCRFEPTCSVYAMQAVQRHGPLRGSALALTRLCRCHPWGGCGHDPVPRREDSNSSTHQPAGLMAQPNRFDR